MFVNKQVDSMAMLAEKLACALYLAGHVMPASEAAKRAYDLAEALAAEGAKRGHIEDEPTKE